MTQLELFRDEPLPPTSCRKFWDRPTQNNEFSVGWERDEIDFDALAHQMTLFLRRAAKKGDGWAISCLVEQAEQLADHTLHDATRALILRHFVSFLKCSA